GSRTLEDLIDLGTVVRDMHNPVPEEMETRAYALRGFVSQPQVQKLNRNSIYLFVNGRLIRDRLLMHALSSAYYNLMPAACFPFALLFLDCDCEEVDVNVHPSKTEVRFRHGSFVHDFVRDTIREALVARRRPLACHRRFPIHMVRFLRGPKRPRLFPRAWRSCPTCARSARSTTASSSRRDGMASGSSTSMWRTSVSSSSRYCASRQKGE